MQTLDVNSLFSRAEQAFIAGRHDEARADLTQVQRLAGPHPAILHLLALVEAKRGAVDAARAAFEAALRLASGDAQLHNNYANFLADAGDEDNALSHYDRALAAAPAFHDARYNRALLFQKLGRRTEALTELDRVAAAAPNEAKVQSARGSVLRELARLPEAAAAYDAALVVDPERLTSLHGRARVAMERGEEAASDFYARALALRPADLELRLGLAEALEAEGDAACVATLAGAVAERPDWAEGQAALARMRWEAGAGTAFTEGFEQALASDPANRDLWIGYASALGAADLAAEAADAAARGRGSIGDDATLMMIEAIHASEAGDLRRADRMFAAAPRDFIGRDLFEARHRIRCGDAAAATALCDAARAASPWDVEAWAITGLVWRLTGDSRASWLLEQPGLVDARPIALDGEELTAIAQRLRSLHRTRAHPVGQSLRGGTQTRGRLFDRAEPEIILLKRAIEAAVGEYWQRLPPADDSHPLLRHRESTPRFAGSWSVRLTDGGYHISHFHPRGTLSSACYFTVPAPEAPMEGWLEVGGPPGGLDVPLDPLARIEPAPGRMALFPSYLFHGTRPFSAGERLTVAFDIMTDG